MRVARFASPLLLLLLVLLPPLAGVGHADDALTGDSWVPLGKHEAKTARGQARIEVSRYESDLGRIGIAVEKGAAEISNVEVTFDNGTKLRPPIKHVFADGTRVRAFDLRTFRAVRSVRFAYKAAKGQPVFVVTGWDQPVWEAKGWTEVGGKQLYPKKPTALELKNTETPFEKLTLVVDWGEIAITELVIKLAGAEPVTVKVGHTFEADRRVRAVDLPRKGVIESVEVKHAGDLSTLGADVQLWAK